MCVKAIHVIGSIDRDQQEYLIMVDIKHPGGVKIKLRQCER